MALAQETELLLLDEPTTYLDPSHQIEVLDLLTDFKRRSETTIVIVMHDLNLVCRYADHLIAMTDGTITAEGAPAEMITVETIKQVFGMSAAVVDDPISGTPTVVPIGRHHCAAADAGVRARLDPGKALPESCAAAFPRPAGGWSPAGDAYAELWAAWNG